MNNICIIIIIMIYSQVELVLKAEVTQPNKCSWNTIYTLNGYNSPSNDFINLWKARSVLIFFQVK